ncbi:S-adenosyl-L-methionine-dependent methyltransferase [Vibrio phage 1.081.O._10N.286.52.C2]|nr:S-adenosyl-L-methionine-dependent methyltransferase [Vibrio phage 1.081.O._10N.286.52.C2]
MKTFNTFFETLHEAAAEVEGQYPAPFDYKFHKYTADAKFTSAATSINSKVNAGFLSAVASHFKPGSTVIDYGAGKYGRVAQALREQGFRVFAYDPYNGKAGADGWTDVSKTLPNGIKFDHGFSSFVLNVVDYDVQAHIVKELESYVTGTKIHIVRGSDIVDTLVKVVTGKSKNPYVMGYVELHYPDLLQKIVNGHGTKADAKWLAQHGVATKLDSFQRWPDLSEMGYKRSGPAASSMWIK